MYLHFEIHVYIYLYSVLHNVCVLQISELKLRDKWAETCVPSGGAVMNPDLTGRRNGQGKSRSSIVHTHMYINNNNNNNNNNTYSVFLHAYNNYHSPKQPAMHQQLRRGFAL